MKNIVKMSFEQVDSVCDALHYAFHPRGIAEDDGIDERLLALWTIFLSYSGWTEEEYWDAENKNRENCICDECKKQKESETKNSVN